MKKILLVISVAVLYGCGGKSTPENDLSVEVDTAVYAVTYESELSSVDPEWQKRLERFMEDFENSRNAYPSVTYSHSNEMNSYLVHYYFEDDFLMWVHSEQSGEGGFLEDFIISLEPEGNTYLKYGTEIEGTIGYIGHESSEWCKVGLDNNFKPFAIGPGDAEPINYEVEYAEHMKTVREQRSKFTLEDGYYNYEVMRREYQGEYDPAVEEKSYRVSEILFSANLLSPTGVNSELIEAYLNLWYPLYEDASGVFSRHIVCSGGEDYININVESGHYRWDEKASGATIDYTIIGFDESEGDAFYATLERNGNRVKKTMVFSESEQLLFIDGRRYTSTPDKYDYITLKCD
ncbi:MAG: hypothetical protein HC811_11090 [Flammeovirgaceae bacterium]|nr:hypothetical protein [Flammeovirgaceae bacterium]